MIVGIGLFIGGVSMLTSSEVTCGGRTMHQGQQCDHVSRSGSTSTNDYGTEKSNGHNSGIFLLILGPLLAVGGAVMGYQGIGQRRAAPPRVAASGPGPLPPAPYPAPTPIPPAVTAGDPYDFRRPTELACVLDPGVVLKRMTSMFVILAVVVWLVAAVALGLVFPHTTVAWLGGSILIAAGTAAAAYNAKHAQLQRNYGQLQKLILHPGGLRRFDPWVVIDIPWTGITAITWRNSALGSPSRVHTASALGGATNAAITAAHTAMAAGIIGNGTIAPLPGASPQMLTIQDRLYGSQLARGYPHSGADCLIFPAEFEHNWTGGVIGAWLRHYRPDLMVPEAPPAR